MTRAIVGVTDSDRDRRRTLKSKARELWAECTDQDGRLDKESVIECVAQFMDDNPILSNNRRIARLVVDEIDRELRPSSEGRQGELFDRDCYVPTGPGERVQMGKMTRIDFIRWGAIDDAEQAASNAKWAQKSGYRNSRLSAWTDDYSTLEDLERAQFGFISDDE